MMEKDSKIYVAGHTGLVGSAIIRQLKREGYYNFIFRTHTELDLTNQKEVSDFFKKMKPEYVFLAAAKVGGILSNKTYPGQFIYINLQIQTAIIHECYVNKVKKMLFLGSSCIYPKFAPQPITEDSLLSGKLEPSNKAYAIAKIAGITMCQSYNEQYGTNFISVMPTNLYGPNDKYDLYNSHALPALLKKIHEAKIKNNKKVEIWGTGEARREFLYVDDLAEACVFLMNNYDDSKIINIGTGKDITIKALAEIIAKMVGYKGKFYFNKNKPDGTPQKLLNIENINNLGWKAKTDLLSGLKLTYKDYLKRFS